MEGHEVNHIKKNRPRLLELTTWNVMLCSILTSESILGSADTEKINSGKTEMEKVGLLYDVIVQKINGYAALVRALETCYQIGAAELLNGIAIHQHVEPQTSIQAPVKITNSSQIPTDTDGSPCVTDPLLNRPSVCNDGRQRSEEIMSGQSDHAQLQNIGNGAMIRSGAIPRSSSSTLSSTQQELARRRKEKCVASVVGILLTLIVVSISIIYYTRLSRQGKTSKYTLCFTPRNTTEIPQINVHNFKEFQKIMNATSNVAAVRITIDVLTINDWPIDVELSPHINVITVAFKGKFCLEIIIPLLQMTGCVTSVHLDISQATLCTPVNTRYIQNNVVADLPHATNFSTVGSISNSNFLFYTLSEHIRMKNLISLKLSQVHVAEESVKYILPFFKQLTALIYLEINGVFETNKQIYSPEYRFPNLKHVVLNGLHQGDGNLPACGGTIFISTEFCDVFEQLESFENNIGYLQFNDTFNLFRCKNLSMLKLGLIINATNSFDLGIIGRLKFLKELILRLEFCEMLCPTEEQIDALQIEKVRNVSSYINSSCAIDLNGSTSIVYQ